LPPQWVLPLLRGVVFPVLRLVVPLLVLMGASFSWMGPCKDKTAVLLIA
jgi:hypothetical protein